MTTIVLHANNSTLIDAMEKFLLKAFRENYNECVPVKLVASNKESRTYEIKDDAYTVERFNMKMCRWHVWNDSEEMWYEVK